MFSSLAQMGKNACSTEGPFEIFITRGLKKLLHHSLGCRRRQQVPLKVSDLPFLPNEVFLSIYN
jgi:hypothetical protein